MELKSKLSKISIKLKNLNENFQCGICQGYIIDATTISECLHSFCKSCIVHFIRTIDHKCPTCNLSLKDIKSCIKSDSSLQRLIYQLIPNLLETELERREKFVLNDKLKSEIILNDKTLLNLRLYFEQNDKIIKEKYIQCVAQTPVSIIVKLLRNKFNIPMSYTIKLSYMKHTLNECENLLQLFTSFILTQNDIFDIKYELIKIKERPVKIECVTQLNYNSNALSKLSIEPKKEETKKEPIKETKKEEKSEPAEPQSNKVVLNKNFLKLKFRNKINQGMQYQTFNLMKKFQKNNKKLNLRPIKKKNVKSVEKIVSNVPEELVLQNKIEETNSTIEVIEPNKTVVEPELLAEATPIKSYETKEVLNAVAEEIKEKAESDEQDEEGRLFIVEDNSSTNDITPTQETIDTSEQKETTEKNSEEIDTQTKEVSENSNQIINGEIPVELPLDLTVQKV